MRFDHPISYVDKAVPNGALFSILIPSWNNLEMLKLCIKSIQKNSSFHQQGGKFIVPLPNVRII